MESLSPQVVFAAKLPILNPNEFDLWKMRIEQYFLMTDYALWEVILNGDSPIPTRVINDVVQPVAPTTAEQRLARKNKLKARETLLMALPDKHQLKLNIHKDAKSLMEAIEKRFGWNKATKKVQKTFLKQCLPTEWRTHTFIWRNKTDLEDQSLDDLFNSLKIYKAEVKVSAVTSVSAASTKVHVSALPNVDTFSDVVIYSFFASQSNSPQRFLQRTKRNLGANETTSIGFDMSKVEYYNCHRRWHFARECMSPKDTRNKETQRRNVPVETFTSNALVLQCDSVGYDNQVFKCTMFDSNELISSKSDVSLPASSVYDRYKSGEGYHVVPHPYTGTFMPLKPDLVFHDAPTINESVPIVFNVEPSPTKPNKDLSHSNRPFSPIIEDWVSDSEDEYKGVPMPTQKAHSFIQTTKHVKTPRPSVKPVEHPIPVENLRKDILTSRGHRHS
nr:ribonuclease H-like domain-containing protein [Tanacetum cinerariifolium]